jgi:ABC-2 type transport system ATP-binding protein
VALIELENVAKLYGDVQALGPLTLSLPETSVGLLGPNGSGKTTLLRIVLGIVPPTSGVVRVLGEEMTRQNRGLRRRIGFVPEGDSLFPGLTGVQAVAYAGRLMGMNRTDALSRAHEVLDYVELAEARYRQAEKYSHGMRQRLKFAQSLVHDPELLVLDEPTEGVDPEARGDLLETIRSLAKEHGVKILVSAHLLDDIEQLTEHAVVLNEGRVAAQGSLHELRAAKSEAYFVRVNGPLEPFTKVLTGANVGWALQSPNVRVDLADPREILRLVRDAGLTVRHLAPAELSLREAVEAAISRPEMPPVLPVGESNG